MYIVSVRTKLDLDKPDTQRVICRSSTLYKFAKYALLAQQYPFVFDSAEISAYNTFSDAESSFEYRTGAGKTP